MNEYPLYPELSEAGQQEAQILHDKFKESLKKIAGETLSELYVDILPHIETDSWTNYRNAMMEGFKNYDNRKVQGEHDFKTIRQEIYKQFRNEIIQDLDQDMVEEIASLKGTIQIMRDHQSRTF